MLLWNNSENTRYEAKGERLNKILKLLLGLGSIFPLTTTISLNISDDFIQFPIENKLAAYLHTNLFSYAVLLTYVLIIGFIVYTYMSNVVPKNKRHLWASVLFLGNMVALPFFWFYYVWKSTNE